MRVFSLSLLLIVLTGCSDNASVNVFDEAITKTDIKCMKLNSLSSDKLVESTLEELYRFNNDCKTIFEVSTKSGIVCNSNQNLDKKALQNFPTSYLKIQIYNPHLSYSYYIDLKEDVVKADVVKAFERVGSDLTLSY